MANRFNWVRRHVNGLKYRHGFVVFFCLLAMGCGASGPVLVQVAGRVTIDGVPVSAGRIEFFPEAGRPSIGNIDDEGHYELRTYKSGDGVRPGKYRVAITSRMIPEDGPGYASFEDEMQGVSAESDASRQAEVKPPRITWTIPQRYSNRITSDLVAEVGNQDADVNFQLQSKP